MVVLFILRNMMVLKVIFATLCNLYYPFHRGSLKITVIDSMYIEGNEHYELLRVCNSWLHIYREMNIMSCKGW